jgi:hypothetical protein
MSPHRSLTPAPSHIKILSFFSTFPKKQKKEKKERERYLPRHELVSASIKEERKLIRVIGARTVGDLGAIGYPLSERCDVNRNDAVIHGMLMRVARSREGRITGSLTNPFSPFSDW